MSEITRNGMEPSTGDEWGYPCDNCLWIFDAEHPIVVESPLMRGKCIRLCPDCAYTLGASLQDMARQTSPGVIVASRINDEESVRFRQEKAREGQIALELEATA